MATTLTTSRPTISEAEFKARVQAVIDSKFWGRVHNSDHRTIIGDAHINLRSVLPRELQNSLEIVEGLFVQMKFFERRNKLEGARRGTIKRKSYHFFKLAHPAWATILETELPKPNLCTTEQLDKLESAIDFAYISAREYHEGLMKDLQAKCDDAQANTYVFKEFRLDHPEAHALIMTGPEDNTDLKPLINALRDFDRLERVLVGTPERILRDMGVCSEEVGRTNRSKGSNRKKAKR